MRVARRSGIFLGSCKAFIRARKQFLSQPFTIHTRSEITQMDLMMRLSNIELVSVLELITYKDLFVL